MDTGDKKKRCQGIIFMTLSTFGFIVINGT